MMANFSRRRMASVGPARINETPEIYSKSSLLPSFENDRLEKIRGFSDRYDLLIAFDF